MKDIEVKVTSDIAHLREVLLAPVKPFTIDDLIQEAAGIPTTPEEDENLRELLARFSVEAPDHTIAAIQHGRLVALLAQHGVIIHWVERAESRIQLYTRDMGFVVDDVYFHARPSSPIRRKEQAGLASLLPRLSRVHELDDGHIEGGDVLVTDDDVLVGLGDSTDPAGVAAFRRALEAEGIDRRVIPMEFTHRGVVHLDVHFMLVGPGVGLFHPGSFSPDSLAYLESRFDLIEVTTEENRGLATNTVSLAPDKLIMQSTHERLAAEIESRGITPIPIDFSEITRFPGGLHCATLPLVRH